MTIKDEQRPDTNFLLEMLLEAAYPPSPLRPDRDEVLGDPRVQQWLLDFGKRRGDFAVVAYDRDAPVGAAWCRVFDSENVVGIVGVIDEATPSIAIAVRPEYRGQGIGATLLDRLCDVCRDNEFDAISLAVGRTNPAMSLYQRAGFQVVSQQDVLVMRKDLHDG